MPGLASATACSWSLRRAAMITWLPNRWKDSARPRPIPLPPPVTRTVLPVICIAVLLRVCGRLARPAYSTDVAECPIGSRLTTMPYPPAWCHCRRCAEDEPPGSWLRRGAVIQPTRVDTRAGPRLGRPGSVERLDG